MDHKTVVKQIKRRIKSAKFTDAVLEMKVVGISLTEFDHRSILNCSYDRASRLSVDLLRYVFYESPFRHVLDPTADQNKLYRLACKYGNSDVVTMLLQDKRFDPMYMDNYPLELAISYGALSIIRALLQDLRVCPFNVLHTVCEANCSNKLDVVKLMLQDTRIKLNTADLSNTLIAAKIHKHRDIEDLLTAVLCGAE